MFYDALSKDLDALLKRLVQIELPEDVYLAGGTACTLFLGHRISYDIDLFTPKDFDSLLLAEELKHNFFYKSLVEKKNTIVCTLDGVKFSLFSYPYGHIEEPAFLERYSLRIASKLDIALMKVIAIHQRGTMKDFIDLKFLIESEKYSFPFLFEKLVIKYGIDSNLSYHIKRGLVYFADAERSREPIVMIKGKRATALSPREWKNIKSFFEKFVLKAQVPEL